MLDLSGFFHLPQLDELIARLGADGPGLTAVAGLDPRPQVAPTMLEGFLPSGRGTVFRILMREILASRKSSCLVVAEDEGAVRVSRLHRRQVRHVLVRPPFSYAERIRESVRQRPDLLVIDRLFEETVPLALEAAGRGLRVLSQLDTVFRGAAVAQHLLDLGATSEQLGNLRWVVAVQRLPCLCPECKEPTCPTADQLELLSRRWGGWQDRVLAEDSGEKAPSIRERLPTYYRAAGCPACQLSGRYADVALFDVFWADPDLPHPFEQPSLLPMEWYAWRLATLGYLALEDILHFENDQLWRTYHLLSTSERALSQANLAMQAKVAELEAAQRVLEQRTEALISLQGIGQALITSTDLEDLAAKICRRARDLAGGDRAILYYLRSERTAEILATSGWDPAYIPREVDASLLQDALDDTEPAPFFDWPPGISPHRLPNQGGMTMLRTGLRLTLVSQERSVGLMIVHASAKERFTPGEVAMLQAFANQAALAIQRAELIAERVKKERMERELELARQVQQSVLPRTFPQVSGYAFAACNEPARLVGGDFYDIFQLDQERFGLVIADVSDKGMPAALYMALTRSLILAEARRERSPQVVLGNVHRLLLELGDPDMFVTVFYGVVEGGTGRLVYTRAGHDPPLLLRGDTFQQLGGVGTLLGLADLEEVRLSEELLDLLPGDRLVLYTDGLTDALGKGGQPLGIEGLAALLQSLTGLPPAQLCEAVFAALGACQGEAGQYDDMTMLVVDVCALGPGR